MNNPNTFSFITEDKIQLTMNLYRAKDNRKNVTIIYFHGGGLLYGVSDDLPEIYINKFLDSGYDFLSFDYPLAPEAKLSLILKSAYEEILYYLDNKQDIFGLENNDYILFGRSAGAYLSFMMCNMLINNDILMPKAIISLYGYTRIDEMQFNVPSKHYNKLAQVPEESIKKILSAAPVTYGPINLRFSLYIKARQEGTWVKYLCNEENPAKYSIKDESLKYFPPTILAASTLDPDVPFKASKLLSRIIPESHLITIYGEVHDFDRDTNNSIGISVYDEIVNWLENKI
ncbi:alpha/beta hydrolase [Clostridium aciditolerans]|uniref:Alpha/beta hydrolase n=1 Tax=Clostridium aciditolerans TaxID=339861 RepID=A0A934M2Z1_9CLOT|nr:alpha/beta hydrolase [Clostridium aciditolerans]MBI6871138.1 alpha/beta hydrolase [Clostridium aciditolerans]